MKIVIIDDDNLVSLSLNTILSAQDDIEVSAVGDSGQQAVKLYEEHMPDVMLMDIRMQGMTGLEAAEKILGKYPDAKILLLTTFSDDEYIVKAISLGAKGYILKQAFESIAPALRAVNNGNTVAFLIFSAHSGCQNITLLQKYGKHLLYGSNIIVKSSFHTETFCLIRHCFYRGIINTSGILP